MSADYARARERMVHGLAARGISDRLVLEAMGRVPRHLFVDEGLRARAYGDHSLPIGGGQTISQPYTVALMTQALGLVGDEKVLEIGTGSAYQTAVLAEITGRVHTIERVPRLAQRARRLLDELGYHRVVVRTGDGTRGWPHEAPFDAIMVTAAAPAEPERLASQLAEGGRLVAPVGGSSGQVLRRYVRRAGETRAEELGVCAFVKLVGRYGWEENQNLE